MQRRRSQTNEHDILVRRANSIGRGLKESDGDGNCGIHSVVDQLNQQGSHASLQSVQQEM